MGFSIGAEPLPGFRLPESYGRDVSVIHGESPRRSAERFVESLHQHEQAVRSEIGRRSIVDAYSDAFPRGRSLVDFLHDAQERIEQSPMRELTLTRDEMDRLMSLGIGAREVEEITRARIDARKQAEPITVESMKAAAERIAYEEIYDVYRHRKEPEGDRLLDVTDRAENLDQACAKLIGLSGLSAEEVEEHELAQFDAGSISELCDRLEELTGDSYSFSNFETPLE